MLVCVIIRVVLVVAGVSVSVSQCMYLSALTPSCWLLEGVC